MSDHGIVTFVPRDTPPARPVTQDPARSRLAPVVPLRTAAAPRLIEPLGQWIAEPPVRHRDVHGAAPGRLARALLAAQRTR